jgi:hypothetical protein
LLSWLTHGTRILFLLFKLTKIERKRRDHIKDSFHTLRDAVPNIKGDKTSRAQILKAATEYIRIIRSRNNDYQKDIDLLRKQNNEIDNQSKHTHTQTPHMALFLDFRLQKLSCFFFLNFSSGNLILINSTSTGKSKR